MTFILLPRPWVYMNQWMMLTQRYEVKFSPGFQYVQSGFVDHSDIDMLNARASFRNYPALRACDPRVKKDMAPLSKHMAWVHKADANANVDEEGGLGAQSSASGSSSARKCGLTIL